MLLVGTRHVNLRGNCACKMLHNTEFFFRDRNCFAVKSMEIFSSCVNFAYSGQFCILSCIGAEPHFECIADTLLYSLELLFDLVF